MRSGQTTSIIAAIATAIATYAFYWFSYATTSDIYYVHGIGFIKNFLDLWTNINANANAYGLPLVFYYGLLVLFCLFLASPILMLLGVKTKWGPLVGCIMPLLISLLVFFYAFMGFFPPTIKFLGMFGDLEPLIEGIIPISLAVEGHYEFYGIY